jgi:threonine aldolase
VDGARLFNAAVALGVPPARLVEPADTVSVCLSKGLSAPAGSVLAGSGDTIYRARRYRKMVGGGMRQAGILAACGLVALRTMVDRLADDHRRARLLATRLAEIPGISIDLSTVQTNIVRFDVSGLGHATSTFSDALMPFGFRVTGGSGPGGVRMVVHRHIDDASVEEAIEVIRQVQPASAAHRQVAAIYG